MASLVKVVMASLVQVVRAFMGAGVKEVEGS